ncbi:MAG: Lrp/AsnC family transcriptional regulator [Candidatus Bathyarchaeota archaeon]|nr:Lrp/AsnC family transcriptional regulator [Candidatus Bathyarchaeota archaeon]
MGTQLDKIDTAIIRALQKDARFNFASIAKTCNVSVDTISKRFHKIANNGVARGTTVLLNPKSFGCDCVGSFGIRADFSHIEAIREFLKGMPEIVFSARTMGRHSIFAVAIVKNVTKLNELKELIKAHPMVREINTSIWVNDILLCPENFDLPKPQGEDIAGQY